MLTNNYTIYLIAFSLAAGTAFLTAPFFRWCAVRFQILDRPDSPIKTHHQSTPYLGGCAIALSFVLSLTVVRSLAYHTYPTGTLRPVEGIFLGGFLIFLLGLADDCVSGGLSYKFKFLIQFIASFILILYGIRIHFIQPRWLAILLSLIWTVGVMNAINIIDIMDGLAAGIAVIASLAFLFISLPTERIYVNITTATLAGSCIGFIPHNLSKSKKMFMGDTGSLFIGFILAALSLGTHYTEYHNAGVFAPILILGVPLYDTFFVMLLRYKKGLSPFRGSKDHFALRLEKMGMNRTQILGIAIEISILLNLCAWITTFLWFWWAIALYAAIFMIVCGVGYWLAQVKIED